MPLYLAIDSQARQTENRHVITCQRAPYNFRRPGVFDRGRAQAIETKNGVIVGIADGEEGFCTAQIVILACMALQEFV